MIKCLHFKVIKYTLDYEIKLDSQIKFIKGYKNTIKSDS